MRTTVLLLLLAAFSLQADDVTALFDFSWTTGPFPTDALTIVDSSQNTGKRVNLPVPATCTPNSSLSACKNTNLLNQLDGFSINPMIVACFSGAIDPNTLADGIQLYPMSNTGLGSAGSPIGINQVLYDPASNCMYAKPMQVLNQQSRYLLVITDDVLDDNDRKTKTPKEFRDCMKGGTPYCDSLSQAVDAVSEPKDHVTSASLFSTMSTTDWPQKARAFVNAPDTPVAAIPMGNPAGVPISSLSSMTWIPQDNAPSPTPRDIPLSALTGVDKEAFGLFLSPNFLNVSGPQAGSITATPTGAAISPPVPIPGLTGVPPGFVPVSFHVFLPPATKMPPGGFPVAIYGHGM